MSSHPASSQCIRSPSTLPQHAHCTQPHSALPSAAAQLHGASERSRVLHSCLPTNADGDAALWSSNCKRTLLNRCFSVCMMQPPATPAADTRTSCVTTNSAVLNQPPSAQSA